MSATTYASGSVAFRAGAREALGVPAAVLGAGFIGYGSLAGEHGYSVAQAVFATAAIWALPGQLILIEMHAVGASALAIIAAVSMSGARFLPMTMTLAPVLRDARYGPATMYSAAQLVSMTTWAAAMRSGPDIAGAWRVPYFAGFGAACLATSAVCAAAGYLLAGALSPLVRLGFVFLAPVYFFVILIGEARTRLAVVALGCGAVAGPLFHLLSPQWSVLAAGFVGGTLAYLIQRAHERGG